MDRRGFLGAILAAGVAPAFIGSSILMPVRKIVIPTFNPYDMNFHDKQFTLTMEELTYGWTVWHPEFRIKVYS